MKWRKSFVIGSFILLLSVLVYGANFDNQKVSIANADSGGGFNNNGGLAKAFWDDGKGNIVRDPATDLPTYIVFNPGTDHYNAYGNRKLWEQYHMGCYLWYTLTEPIPHKQTTAQSIDYAQLIENRAERPNLDYEWLVERKKGLYQNLKLGSHEPNKHGRESFNGVETGTTVVVNPAEYRGKRYEWRYLGYAINGVPIENPFFPPDYPSASDTSFDPKKKDWWIKPWESGNGHPKKIEQSPYDGDPEGDPAIFKQKVEWFVKYLFPELPQFRRADKYPNIYDDAADWANKFSLRTHPEKSTGVIVGFHGSGYYASFSLKPPELANMRLIEMKVFDKATGKLIGHFVNDASGSSCDLGAFDDKRWVINNSEVSVGDTLVVQATIKNMVIEGKEATTKHTPLRLYQMVSIDEDSVVFPNDWTIEPVDNVIPSINLDPEKRKNNLKPGETITFDMVKDDQTGQVAQWEFTVTPDIKKEFVLAAEIHDQHFLRGDNHYTGDDFGRLRFKIEQQDIATSDDMAELLDENGNVVTNVSPHKPHGLRIYLTRPKGKTPVGDPNNPTANPFAMVEVEVTDGVNTYVLEGQAKEVLKKGGKVAIDIPNAITPLTSKITAKWKVHWMHQATRQNEIFTNDAGTGRRVQERGLCSRNGFELSYL